MINKAVGKYIFVTGGVVSSLGKGIASASLAAILESRGLKVTLIKFDPYLNVDPGTMNPLQHGEVFVTDDGAETDLDLGHYERFISTKMSKKNNITSGQIFDSIINKERKGEYLGVTVQIIPHVTDEIKQKIIDGSKGFDVSIIEIGGTVGDIESQPFLEAIRQMRIEYGYENTLFIHLTLLPYIPTAGEIKTKPTQHSVKELRSIGIQPDILLCRSAQMLSNNDRAKIALFTNVIEQAVISCPDMPTILSIPVVLANQDLDKIVLGKLKITAPIANLSAWHKVLNNLKIAEQSDNAVTIAIVGKYINFNDAYKSLNEALIHASINNLTKLKIINIYSEELEHPNSEQFKILQTVNGIIVPGGFGKRGIEGKIKACEFARKNNIPFLGICLGLQIAVVEYARNVLGWIDANSTEFDHNTQHPVVALVTEWLTAAGTIEQRDHNTNLGGTMRLGKQKSILSDNSKIKQIYQQAEIFERHRHRYEVNEQYLDQLTKAGLLFSGYSIDNLVEVLEIPTHPWFIGCQFHPELTSKPEFGHLLFNSFIKASLARAKTL
ncbi:MAG: CTP synthase [Gammaproteobacteria bacterium]|jgi:CTP synthase